MLRANEDLRSLARGANIPLWIIAEHQNISEGTLLRNWRHELNAEGKTAVKNIIESIKKGEAKCKTA